MYGVIFDGVGWQHKTIALTGKKVAGNYSPFKLELLAVDLATRMVEQMIL